jgi:hypothetical protein
LHDDVFGRFKQIIIEKYKDIKLTLTDKGQKAAASQKEQNI